MWREEGEARADPAGCLFVAGLAGLPVCHWLSKLGWLMILGCLEGQGWACSADGPSWQQSGCARAGCKDAPLLVVVFDLYTRQTQTWQRASCMSSTTMPAVSINA